jgi:hypothetical protein
MQKWNARVEETGPEKGKGKEGEEEGEKERCVVCILFILHNALCPQL